MKLKISEIVINEDQPRKYFDEEKLNELASSIKADGLQEPILVRPMKNGKYEIVQGERRYRAHNLAGLDEIEVKIKELNDMDAFHLSIIENIQREQLTPIEEAHAFMKYVEMGYTHEQIAEKVSKSRTYVTSRLRLLKLVPFIQDWIVKGILSDGHAKQILKMESIINRFWNNNRSTYDSPFEELQYKFHHEYWYHEAKRKKITVKDVEVWADNWRYGLIKAIVNHYKGLSEYVIADSKGLPITSELQCAIYNMDISMVNEEDVIFANKFEQEYFKESFNETFRPWMIDRFWDELKQELFSGNKKIEWNNPRNINELVEVSKGIKEQNQYNWSLVEATKSILSHKNKLETALN